MVKQYYLLLLLFTYPLQLSMAEETSYPIDDRSSGNLNASTGNNWRLFTDDVMGGISKGTLTAETIEQRACLRMQGDVRLDNNGGFVQIALDLPDQVLKNIEAYKGIVFEVYGNDESYNIHLRTNDLWLPWQSYRASFNAQPEWKTLSIAFSEFEPYRTSTKLDIRELERVGIVAIGREFKADVCVGKVSLYR